MKKEKSIITVRTYYSFGISFDFYYFPTIPAIYGRFANELYRSSRHAVHLPGA